MARYRYEEPGALVAPRWIGRSARLLLGMGALWVVGNLVAFGAGLVTGGHLAIFPGWWLFIGIGVFAFPDVVNIGWGLSVSRRRLFAALAGLALALALVGRLVFHSPWGPPLGAFVYGWLFYTFAHLGVAFLIAAALGTPGCEMRSIPDLWARLTGGDASEHYCPGPVSAIDRWEARVLGNPAPPGDRPVS